MRPAVKVAKIAGASRHSRLETEPMHPLDRDFLFTDATSSLPIYSVRTFSDATSSLQCVAQFSYTLVCNRCIFLSVRRKFLKFLLKTAHLLTFNIHNDWPLDRCTFKIMPFFPKLLSCPVFVHLAQFSYIDKTTFLHENARRKLMCQPPC